MKFHNLLTSVAVASLVLGGAAVAQQAGGQTSNQSPANQSQQQTGSQGQQQGGQQGGQQGQPQGGQQAQQQGQQQDGQQAQQQGGQQAQQQGGQQGQPQGGQQAQQQGQQQDGQQAQQQQGGQQAQGAKVYISAAAIRDIQKTLNQQGFDVGSVDGTLEEQALRNFQEANNIAPTGKLTVATIRALGMEDMLLTGAEAQEAMAAGDVQPTAIMVGPDLIRQVQQALNDQGYDVGKIDGEWGDKSKSAAQKFAQEQGLRSGGNLTMQLIDALGVDLGATAAAQGSQQQAQAAGGQQQPEAVPLYVSPQVIVEAKKALNEMGYDAGSLNPQWNDNAKTALKNFQQMEGLPTSENLTVSTLRALGVDFRTGSMGAEAAELTAGEMEDDLEVEVLAD